MADSMHAPENDLVRASLLAFPVLLVALLFIFRGLRRAGSGHRRLAAGASPDRSSGRELAEAGTR